MMCAEKNKLNNTSNKKNECPEGSFNIKWTHTRRLDIFILELWNKPQKNHSILLNINWMLFALVYIYLRLHHTIYYIMCISFTLNSPKYLYTILRKFVLLFVLLLCSFLYSFCFSSLVLTFILLCFNNINI